MIVPRIKGIDQSWAAQLIQYNEQSRLELLRELGERPEGGTQLLYAMLADHCHDLGLLHYAIGSSIKQVRDSFANAAQAFLHVFELRGTQPNFDVTLVKLRPVSPSLSEMDDPENAANAQSTKVSSGPLRQRDRSDDSLTNSRTGLRAMYLALTVDQPDLARKIAKMVFDPSNATYIGPDSVVCTVNEQHLAYGLKLYLLEDPINAELQLRMIENEEPSVNHQATMIKALIDQNPQAFLSALNELLSDHRQQAESDTRGLEWFVSVPGLGLSAAALLAGIDGLESLPDENIYLPLSLLQSMNEADRE